MPEIWRKNPPSAPQSNYNSLASSRADDLYSITTHDAYCCNTTLLYPKVKITINENKVHAPLKKKPTVQRFKATKNKRRWIDVEFCRFAQITSICLYKTLYGTTVCNLPFLLILMYPFFGQSVYFFRYNVTYVSVRACRL